MSWDADVTRITPYPHLLRLGLYIEDRRKRHGFFTSTIIKYSDLRDDQLESLRRDLSQEIELRAAGPLPYESDQWLF